MKTVVKIVAKVETSVLMYDGFGNIYLGETILNISEGDHGLIETLPEVKLVKKLVDNEVLWADDDFLLDNNSENWYTKQVSNQ